MATPSRLNESKTKPVQLTITASSNDYLEAHLWGMQACVTTCDDFTCGP